MNSSFITRLFFLVVGVYLFSLFVYFQASNIRLAGENFRITATTIMSDDPSDSRQNSDEPQFLQSRETASNSEESDEELEFKSEVPQVVKSEDNDDEKEEETDEEEEAKIVKPDPNEIIISDLRRELGRTRSVLQKFKEAKDNVTEQAEKIKENLKIVYSRYQGKNKTLSYVADVFAQINPFRRLGLYETMPNRYYNQKPSSRFLPNQQYNAIKHNPGYCDAVDLYNLKNPDNLFKNMNFIADYSGDEILPRVDVMRKIGNDVMPGLTRSEPEHQSPKYDLAVNGTMYFFKKVHLHTVYQMNQEWACLSQMYNHIPGNGVLTRKDLLVETINTYTQRYANKPQCIQEDKFFPTAFQLNIKSECDRFFSIIRSSKYYQNKATEPVQYIIKTGYGAHRASGIFLMDDQFETKIRQMYHNGELCGVVKKPYVAQKYISNPLLLDKKNKFDFRIYMTVASVDPLIVYYHDGFLRVSLSEYDKFSKEKNVHFTNTHLSKELFQKAQEENTFNGMTEEQLRDYQMWTMEELQSYLLETGKIQDENWLENYLRPKFKEAFVHIARMAESSFYKSPSVFEMYGLDFVLDENLDIWLIEVNASPQLVGTSEKKSSFLTKMLTDLFELEYSYLRSRMKRVHNFVNDMEKRTLMGEQIDYTRMSREFKKININKLEPEFEISKNNSFVKILDKNLKGPAAYFGHIHDQCVN